MRCDLPTAPLATDGPADRSTLPRPTKKHREPSGRAEHHGPQAPAPRRANSAVGRGAPPLWPLSAITFGSGAGVAALITHLCLTDDSTGWHLEAGAMRSGDHRPLHILLRGETDGCDSAGSKRSVPCPSSSLRSWRGERTSAGLAWIESRIVVGIVDCVRLLHKPGSFYDSALGNDESAKSREATLGWRPAKGCGRHTPNGE